ncbi:conserved hypothetical protein [Ricinus communis]|uniref:Uncharacterized protein n=1 Tax=Ricinus communis TaxID=3988 RepID=B9S9N3_RICCO|nr:conserved hypothetical protein [Ricinus communis]
MVACTTVSIPPRVTQSQKLQDLIYRYGITFSYTSASFPSSSAKQFAGTVKDLDFFEHYLDMSPDSC